MSKQANEWLEKISSLQNAAGKSLLHLDGREDISIPLRADRSVTPGMFRPDPLIPGGHLAHPTTLAALKKDIFAVGDELFSDLEQIVDCDGCKRKIDTQFWHFCPHCESPFKS